VASSRTTIQALSGVLISADGEQPLLLATDTEVGLRLPLEGEIINPGSAVLPARLLLEVVRSLPGESMTLELRPTEQDVELISRSATFHLRTLRSDDFPKLPLPDPSTRMSLPAQAFVDTALQVSRSASRDETRPVLTGVLVSAAGSELRMVATDSYRLSVKSSALESPLEGTIEANVPARALAELARIVQGSEIGSLSVSLGQSQIVFELDHIVLSSRLIDGQFPNYRQLLPESVEHELRLSTGELVEVVRRISLLAQKNAPLRLTFETGQLTVSAQTPDVGEASEALPVPFSGERFEIGFNPEFLRDGLESVESEELLFKLISALRPGLIESPERGEFVYLIMPIRLST
jgi:DNA polymerase-3 subunit beta